MSRSVEEVRRQLASERERLTAAVDDLREEGGRLRSKLPVVAGALAGLLALRAVVRRALRNK
jgi:hypothetical protein